MKQDLTYMVARANERRRLRTRAETLIRVAHTLASNQDEEGVEEVREEYEIIRGSMRGAEIPEEDANEYDQRFEQVCNLIGPEKEHPFSKIRNLEGEATPEEPYNVEERINRVYEILQTEGPGGSFCVEFAALRKMLDSDDETPREYAEEDKDSLRKLSEMNYAYRHKKKQ